MCSFQVHTSRSVLTILRKRQRRFEKISNKSLNLKRTISSVLKGLDISYTGYKLIFLPYRYIYESTFTTKCASPNFLPEDEIIVDDNSSKKNLPACYI